MAFLKEDGSLDIERINAQSLKEYMNTMSDLTDEQLAEYRSNLPIKESRCSVKAIKVDFGLDDERSGVDADEYLEKKKKSFHKNLI